MSAVLMFPPQNVFNVDLDCQTIKEAKAVIEELNRDYHRVTIFIHNGAKNFRKYQAVTKLLKNLGFNEADTCRWENFI